VQVVGQQADGVGGKRKALGHGLPRFMQDCPCPGLCEYRKAVKCDNRNEKSSPRHKGASIFWHGSILSLVFGFVDRKIINGITL
jgi:hypothetical protein